MHLRETGKTWFTLIEIVVSITILSIVLVSVFEIYSNILVMSKRLELGRSLQQNARSVIESVAHDIREGRIAFECYEPSSSAPSGCDGWPHPRDYSGSGAESLLIAGKPGICPSGTSSCYIQYFLAKATATVWEVACSSSDMAVPGQCYLSRRVMSGGVPVGDPVRLTDPLTSISNLRFYLSWVGASGFSSQSDQEWKVTLIFTLSLAPRQWLDSKLAEGFVIPVQTTITERLYKNSN